MVVRCPPEGCGKEWTNSFLRVLNQAAHPTQRQPDGTKHSRHVQLWHSQPGGPSGPGLLKRSLVEMEGPIWFWESLWPSMSALDVTSSPRHRQKFQRGKEVRKARGALLFVVAKHAPWDGPKTRTREHRKPDFYVSSSLGWQTRVSPPEMTLCDRDHSNSFLGLVSGHDGPEAPRLLRAQGLLAPEVLTRQTRVVCLSLKVSHHHQFAA